MRTINFKQICLLLTFVFVSSLYAQEKSYQLYSVHEDQVKPSKVMQYEKTAKMLTDKMKEHNITSTSWLSSTSDDFKYLWVTPIENMADLDDNSFWKELSDAMGEEAFTEMMNGFNGTYAKHGDYVISMDKDLTYMPDGITQTPEGENYRKFYYIHYAPENAAAIKDAMKGVKDFFASKGSKSHYRVYHSSFGTMDSYFLVAVSAKDAIDMAQKSAANDKLLGPEAQAVFGKVMAYVTEMDEVTGMVRPDLSYMPKKKTDQIVSDD